jgi:translation initiation factor 2 alpha subunit (eIF-2alpha)
MFYYKNNRPVINDIVYVSIKEFSDTGVYCELIEYDNMSGFLLISELYDKIKKGVKPKSPDKLLSTQKTYPMLVLTINEESHGDDKKYILDLSYKKIKKEDREQLLEKFIMMNKLIHLANEFEFITKLSLKEIYKLTIWKLFDTDIHDDLSLIDDMKLYHTLYLNILKNPHIFTKYINDAYPTETKQFIDNFNDRLTSSDMMIEQIFELMIHEENAITKLKDVLTYDNDGAEIVYISSPRYQILVKGSDILDCDSKIEKCLEYIKNKISLYHCVFNLKEKNIIRDQEFTLKSLKMD